MAQYLMSGLRVLDVATVIAGPAAAMMLADFGADVIKIEQPGTGDQLRALGEAPAVPRAEGNYPWQLDGRNKRSLTLDLKSPLGYEVLRRLVAGCDVYITNQPLAVRASLRLRYEDLEPLNPRMIYASLTAYGERGPERARKGFDQLAYWARSGLMDLMREPDGTPIQGLPGMGDHPTAVALYAGIVTALLARERSGRGSMVETSLLANGLWSASCIAQGVMAGGDMPKYREDNRVRHPIGRVYRCRDGRFLQFNMVRTEELLALMFEVLGLSHLLEDPRFDSLESRLENKQELGDEIQRVIATRDSAAWLESFDARSVPVNRIARVEETVDDPQVLENRMAAPPVDPELPVPLLVNHPVRVSSVPQVGARRAPELGEHSVEILEELGYDTESIARMRETGVV